MKSKMALWQLCIGTIVMGGIIRYTYDSHVYWLLVIEIPIGLFLLLRSIVEFYNDLAAYKDRKAQWEQVGTNIVTFWSMARVRPDLSFNVLKPGVLRSWKEWVTDHPVDENARQAFVEICTAVVGAPSDSGSDPSVRAEAQIMLDELAGVPLTPGDKLTKPVDKDTVITCGSCSRQMIYKGKDAPVGNAMKGEYAMYCRSCGKAVCIPCVAVAMATHDIIDCTAKVMTGHGKCPCCGALSVNAEK